MRNLTLTVCLILSIQSVTAQLQSVVWKKCFGGTAKDVANDILLNSDGTIVVAGYAHSTNGNITGHHGDSTTADGWVIKLDSSGSLLWQKSVGGNANDYLNTVIATDDGGYLCTGYTYSNDGDVTGNHGMADVWAIKLNSGGGLVWSKCFGGSQMDTAIDAVKLHDGQLAVIGSTNSLDGNVLSGPANNTAYDPWVVKLNKINGDLVWEKVINTGDSMLNKKGLNIVESNTNTIIALVGANSTYQYWSVDHFETVSARFARTYQLNEITGNAELFKFIAGDDKAVMYKTNTGYSFVYDDISFTPSPSSCYSYTRINKSLDFAGNVISEKRGFKYDCTLNWEWARPESNIDQAHGLIISSTGNFISVGNAPDAPLSQNSPNRAYISSLGNIGPTWIGGDNFSAVKELAIGDEFVVVGGTTSGRLSDNELTNADDFHGKYDFWVIKYQSLNRIQGNFYIDYNNNNVKDANEPPFRRAVAKTIKQNATDSWWSYPVNGLSQSVVNLGTYKTSASVLHPYYTLTADTATNTFTTYRNTVTINYPVHPIPGSRDYAVFLSSLSPLRPGFVTQNRITYTNFGVDTLTNKSIRLVLNSHLNFTSSTPAPTNMVADTITWNIAQLLPDSSGFINLYLTTDNIPDVNIDDTLRLTAYIDNTGDVKPSDNVSSILQGVRGSYDPNDKKENYGGSMPLTEASSGKYLTYTIRFQNTGNDTAFNIVVRDTLSTLLDSTSFEMINASHSYTVSIKDGKYVVWKFNDIKLPDSFSNEPLSHGSITYRIKPKLPIGIGEKIKNSAAIYFDYNPPIITNTSITEIKGNPTIASWRGTVSTAWENALNWSNRLVPDMNTTVTIPANVPNYPEINSNASCYRITVMPSATVLVKTGFKLQVTAKN